MGNSSRRERTGRTAEKTEWWSIGVMGERIFDCYGFSIFDLEPTNILRFNHGFHMGTEEEQRGLKEKWTEWTGWT